MLAKQSLAVDTSKFEKYGLTLIAADISALKDYLRKHPTSLYATPQLLDQEEPKAIIVLRMRQKGREVLMTMINPIILGIKDTIAVEETQDQVEGTYLNIRHPQLHIAYVGLPKGEPLEVTLSGKSALIFQQALRLTQGITIDTFGFRVDDYPEYVNGTEEEKQDIIQNYMKVLKELHEENLQDEDTKEYMRATDFLAENAESSVNAEFTRELQDAYAEVTAAEEKVKANAKVSESDNPKQAN